MRGDVVMGERGVQEGLITHPRVGPCVEEQRSGGVIAYLHHLGAAHQEVQDPVAQGEV